MEPDKVIFAIAPTNVAADNLGKKLVKAPALKVRRMGDLANITDDQMKSLSSRAAAVAAEGDATNAKAKRRRREFEAKYVNEGGVIAVGTLDATGSIRHEKVTFKAPLTLTDEAAKAREPDAIATVIVSSPDAHLVLIGDHRQLPPTVNSRDAEWAGLGTSLFERLIRSPGTTEIMLERQYRMHPMICRYL